MGKIKKTFSAILSATVLCLCLGNSAYAAETEQLGNSISDEELGPFLGAATECDAECDLPINNDSSSQFFAFVDDGQKMDANGNFIFSFSWAMESTSFRPSASSIDVYATATTSNNNKTYYIGLKEVGGSSLGYHSYTANGTQQQGSFSGLDSNKWYVLYFSKPATSSATITGSGHVDYIR